MQMKCQAPARRLANATRRRARTAAFAVSLLVPLALLAPGRSAAQATGLPVVAARAASSPVATRYDGEVQAIRRADVAAQVAGSVLELGVRAGDTVRAGDVLVRIDARAAEQAAAATGAQVAAAQAALDVASSELARQRQLAEKKYISQGALEQAESNYRAAQAQVRALSSQAGAARTQTAFHVVQAPFDGIVAATMIERGDMAMPGRPLLTVYDPTALRVSAHVPASMLTGGAAGVRVWLEGASAPLAPARVQVLPTVDPRTLTQEVRAELAPGTAAVPGQFARLQFPPAAAGADAAPRIFVPVAAIVRRAEVTAVYVLGADQQPRLRQVRLGLAHGDEVEVLTGLDAGEPVVTDPHAATRAAVQAKQAR